MAREGGIQSRVIAAVKARGGWSVNTHGTVMGRRGVPDVLVCYRGCFIGMEVKQPGAEATPIQRHELRRIREAGGVAGVVTSPAMANELMDQVDIKLGVRAVEDDHGRFGK